MGLREKRYGYGSRYGSGYDDYGYGGNDDVTPSNDILTDETIREAFAASIAKYVFTEDVYYYAIEKTMDNDGDMKKLKDVYEKDSKKPSIDEKTGEYTDDFVKFVSNAVMDKVDAVDKYSRYEIPMYISKSLLSDDICDDVADYFSNSGQNGSQIQYKTISNYINKRYSVSPDKIEKMAEKYIDSNLSFD